MKCGVLITSLIMLAGCASTSGKTQRLTYENVKSLSVGKSTSSEVIATLGSPSDKNSRDGYFSLQFNDPSTGVQRVTANFDDKTSKLIGILWIPTESDPQISLSNTLESFQGASFVTEQSERDRIHSISRVKFYIDQKRGITIRYDENLKQVEGISFYEGTGRLPSNNQ
ncbi:hypothetical protein [uncultured Bdellovibrio sp.]|uniref:hypothetical protein n=1 Tax=Bdellovibrio sp. HCB-162 TaxID=3394234 RepID=UPI0025DE5EA5|nr:hypothetical protein [uncultured Bdellovibrio sp.]